jgi:hypothetical protein
VLSGARPPVLLVGNEGLGYAELAPPQLEVVLCQALSLMGQDRSRSPSLEECLRDAGVQTGARVGVAGWKYFRQPELGGATPGIAAPAFLVDLLREIAGDDAVVEDVTPALMGPGGVRRTLSATEVAAYEWAAARSGAAVFRILDAARPGLAEFEAVAAMRYAGEPLAAHVMFASGPGQIVGLRSPGARRLAEGDAVTTAIGFWGGLTCRAGTLRERPDDAVDAALGRPYFDAISAWYGTVRIGVTGGEVFAAVEDALAGASFRPMLNPGHLIGLDEWIHSPIVAGGDEGLEAGTALQCDIIPAPVPDGAALNCEDGIVLADAALREELAAAHPEVWSRVEARRAFMRDELGIELADDVLPLSAAPGYLPPAWLSPDLVYVRG